MSITFDDIGPERIHQFYDPGGGMRAAPVKDTTVFLFSGGGVNVVLESEAAEARRYVGQRKNRGKVLPVP